MSSIAGSSKVTDDGINDDAIGSFGEGNELLMFAIPHQQQRLVSTPQSSNRVTGFGCTPTLLGAACPVVGSRWALVEHLHRFENRFFISFFRVAVA